MRPHDVERLSAYFDRELPPEDRAAVEAHLQECPECSGRLGELAAVDATARALPRELPPGAYFESFPSVVRGRLETARPVVRLGRPWLLAAAAALVLAVLTPATLREGPAPGVVSTEADPRAARDADLETAAPPATSGASVPSGGSPPAPQPRQQATVPAPVPARPAESRDAGPPPPARAKPQAPPAPEAGATREGALPAHGERQDESDRFAERDVLGERPLAGESAPPAPVSPTPGPYGFAPAPAAADRAAPASTEAGAAAAMADRKREGARTPDAQAASGYEQREEVAGRLEGGEQAVSPAQSRYESLLARPVTSAEDARALREAWRAFSADHPDGPWADEARVRVVEVGADAYRRGGDPEDLALVRRDAQQYLKLGRATQARRVLDVLRSLR